MNLDLLYMFGFSPRISYRLERLHEVIEHQLAEGKTVGIAFLHDGVVGTAPRGSCPETVLHLLDLSVKIFALGPDLDARGLGEKPLQDGIKRINYDELIELIVDSETLCSWM